MEAYLLVALARSDQPIWLLAVIASAGQGVGKLAWFYAARGSLRVGFLQRRLERPKVQASVEKWSRRVGDRTWVGALMVLVSALVGLPPFFAMAVIAGTLRVRVWVFVVFGFIGRTGFFWLVLSGAGLLVR